MKHAQIDLEEFLAELPEEDAANARAAAARIDELEYAAQRIGRSDQRFMKLFALAGICTVAAVVAGISAGGTFRGGGTGLTDLAILLLASAFPVMVLVYSLKMSERTKLDRRKFEIIETYFLPHDAIYLPPGPDRAKGVIAKSRRAGGWYRTPEGKEKVRKPGWYW